MPQSVAKASDDRQSALMRARWELAIVEELVFPASVQFLPLRNLRNEVVDLRCTVGNAAVAHLFRDADGDPVGRRLRAMAECHPNEHELVAAYLSVARSGEPLLHTSWLEDAQLLRCVEHAIYRPRQNCVIAQLNIPGLELRVLEARRRVASLESHDEV